MTAAPPTTLADWLLARIADDEAGPWEHYRVESEYHSCPAARDPQWSGDLEVGEEFCDCGMPQRRARMLAECEAKRRIVELHKVEPASVRSDSLQDLLERVKGARPVNLPYGCVICAENDRLIEPEGFCDTVKLLALPYADHDGYRDEWRP